MEEQTIRNLFEAFLQTAYLSPEQVVEILRIKGDTGEKLANHYEQIRNDYLDNLENGSEEYIEEYIDKLFWYLN